MSQPVDSFDNALDGVSSPARRAVAIVPPATQPLALLPKALLHGKEDIVDLSHHTQINRLQINQE